MCELLGMNASLPTDIIVSLKALARRGSGNSPHRDGWGIAFYKGTDIQIYRDPTAITHSAISRLLQQHPIRSETVIAHIRQANVGNISLPNTHPFTRELWGQHWTFAHNGQLKDFTATEGFYKPEGATDSEAIFCDLLNLIRERFPERAPRESVIPFIAQACAAYRTQGPLNCLLSNSEWLFSYCSTKLASVTRRRSHPTPYAHQGSANEKLLQEKGFHPDYLHRAPTLISLIATEPLTQHEKWQRFSPGEWKLWQCGRAIAHGFAHA